MRPVAVALALVAVGIGVPGDLAAQGAGPIKIGFMAGIELVKDRDSREPYAPAERIGHYVALEARRQGLLLRPLGHVLVLMPPLITTRRDLARMVCILHRAIEKVTGAADR